MTMKVDRDNGRDNSVSLCRDILRFLLSICSIGFIRVWTVWTLVTSDKRATPPLVGGGGSVVGLVTFSSNSFLAPSAIDFEQLIHFDQFLTLKAGRPGEETIVVVIASTHASLWASVASVQCHHGRVHMPRAGRSLKGYRGGVYLSLSAESPLFQLQIGQLSTAVLLFKQRE